jgi:excisionase family DNA binding protein
MSVYRGDTRRLEQSARTAHVTEVIMDRQEQQRLLQQLETVIEQAHRLQLELLGLMRSMMAIEPPASISSMPEARDAPLLLDLPDKPMFSVEEVAAILGVGRGTAYQCARSGEIPSLRLGHRILIPRTALVRMLGG